MLGFSRRRVIVLVVASLFGDGSGNVAAQPEPSYTIAFASFGPRNTDLFVADADGQNPKPLVPHAKNDCNASFSADGSWVVFTSYRNGPADLYRVHPDGTGLDQLTVDPAFDDQAALSPDGKQIAFVSNRDGLANLWLLDLATKTVSRLTKHDSGDFRPAWSPDGQWIAFSSDRDSKKPRGAGGSGFGTVHVTETYVVRSDGTGLRRVTRALAFAGSPTWSPDGNKPVIYEAALAETSKIASPARWRGTTQIATIDVATGKQSVVTSGQGEKWSPRWVTADRIGYVSGGPDGGIEFTPGKAGARGEFRCPNWSKDGRRMVFHREVGPDGYPPPLRDWHSLDRGFRLIRTGVFPSFSPKGDRLVSNSQPAAIIHNTIVLMNADGSNRSTLFEDPKSSAVAPAGSPKGDQIAFGLGRFFQVLQGPAIADIAVIGADGKGFRRLTDGKGNSGFPSWAPDGRRLVYRTSSADGKSSWLVIHDIETGEVKELKTDSTRDNFPAWSPTGDLIAFTGYLDGNYEMCTIKPDGTEFQRLTHSPGNDAHCAWSPDGQWIAFTSARRWFNDEAALHRFNGQPYGKIYVMRADGSDVRQLTEDQFAHGTVAFVPLGNRK
jgi:TolB protein